MKSRAASVLFNGILKQNPVLVLMLGCCSTLAVATSAKTGFFMGVVTLIVLVCSNTVISMLKNLIPEKVRLPAYIVIISTFVTIMQILSMAFAPAVYKQLGIFLPLITVNCIVFGRAEVFASKNGVFLSMLDGISMGAGFTAVLFFMGAIREIIGFGTILGFPILPSFIEPMRIFVLPAGGFFVFGMLIMISNKLSKKKNPNKDVCQSCGACGQKMQQEKSN